MHEYPDPSPSIEQETKIITEEEKYNERLQQELPYFVNHISQPDPDSDMAGEWLGEITEQDIVNFGDLLQTSQGRYCHYSNAVRYFQISIPTEKLKSIKDYLLFDPRALQYFGEKCGYSEEEVQHLLPLAAENQEKVHTAAKSSSQRRIEKQEATDLLRIEKGYDISQAAFDSAIEKSEYEIALHIANYPQENTYIDPKDNLLKWVNQWSPEKIPHLSELYRNQVLSEVAIAEQFPYWHTGDNDNFTTGLMRSGEYYKAQQRAEAVVSWAGSELAVSHARYPSVPELFIDKFRVAQAIDLKFNEARLNRNR